jgi:hypothetical protein
VSWAGAEWETTAQAGITVEYNDNRRLVTQSSPEVAGYIADAAVNVQRQSENWQIAVRPRLRSSRYRGDDTLDSDDQFVSGSLDVESERAALSIPVSYSRESTLTSEFESSGIVQVNKRRNLWAVDPQWSYALRDWLTAQVATSYSEAFYEDAENTGLQNYDYRSSSVGFSGDRHAEELWSVVVYWSDYRVPDDGRKTSTYGWQGSYSGAVSDALHWSVGLGTRRSTHRYDFSFPYSDITLKDDGWLANASITLDKSAVTWHGTIKRELQPSGSGYLQLSDKLTLDVRVPLREGTSLAAAVVLSRNEDLSGSPSAGQHRDYSRGEFALYHDLTETIRIRGAYVYSWQQYQGDKAASSNAFYLTANYSGR